MAATDTDDDSSSLFAGLLQQLLLLLKLPSGAARLTPAAREACVAARQRLRELLWRDLEQVWLTLALTRNPNSDPKPIPYPLNP